MPRTATRAIAHRRGTPPRIGLALAAAGLLGLWVGAAAADGRALDLSQETSSTTATAALNDALPEDRVNRADGRSVGAGTDLHVPKDMSQGSESSPPRLPGPARRRGRPGAAAQNAACEACHPAVAAEWRASLHRKASTEPSYVRALAREPSAFCRGCHAPEGDPDDPGREARSLGVGCVTCHAPEGVVLAAPPSDLSPETAPHALIRTPAFASPGACAGCHEFEFPGSRALMQSTVSEHQASTHAALPCAGCHMPVIAGGAGRRRSHAFVASRDPEHLRQALRVRGERSGPTSVRLTLGTGVVGHAFPTGDLFRRLVIRAQVIGGRGRPARAQRVLTRHFGADTRTLVADDRVGAPSLAGADVIVDLELGEGARGRPIGWEIRYERVAFPRDASDQAELDGAERLEGGVLAP